MSDFSSLGSLFPNSSDLWEQIRKLRQGEVGFIGVTPNKAGDPDVYYYGVRKSDEQKVIVDLRQMPGSLPAENAFPTMWEYLYKTGPQEKQLESLGKEGWELCAVTTRPDGELWIFKRPKFVFGDQSADTTK